MLGIESVSIANNYFFIKQENEARFSNQMTFKIQRTCRIMPWCPLLLSYDHILSY